MTIIFTCLGAALLVLTGALISGGLRLPVRPSVHTLPSDAADDPLAQDLAALLRYGREEEDDAV